MTTTLKKALALAMCLTMLVLAVPGFASGEATGPQANAAREMVNSRFSQYANSVDDQEGMANDPIKKAIEQDIHKFSHIPCMTDESFGGNVSGVAMEFKLLGMENITKIKTRYYKKGIIFLK